MNAHLRHLVGALLLLTFSASVVEAARMPACVAPEAKSAPAGHTHQAPMSDGAGDGAAPGGTNECPMLSLGTGCTVASLPAPRYDGDLPRVLDSRGAPIAAGGHSLLLVRDRFHPPRG